MLTEQEAGLRGAGHPPPDKVSLLSRVLDGMLYSGTMNNFQGNEPILMRTLGSQPVLKTDNFLRWLQRKALSPSQHRSGPFPSQRPGNLGGCHLLRAYYVRGTGGRAGKKTKLPSS